MNYDELIGNWHARNPNEDSFSKFVFEYLAFIAFLLKRRFPEARHDRDAIQALKQDEIIKKLYLKKIEDTVDLRNSWTEVRNELSNAPLGNASGSGDSVEDIKWWNYSGNHLDQQNQLSKDKGKGVIYGLDDWGNMIEFWYAVRSNLFHGSKNPESNRDQILVKFGHKTLGPLVEIFLKEDF